MAIRQDIMTALVAGLETIDGTGSWRSTINLVEQKALDWSELAKSQANATDGGYLGVISQEETFADMQGRRESVWAIDIVAHVRIATSTGAAALAAASNLTSDIGKLLNDTLSSNLGVAGVHWVRYVRRNDSLGSPEALAERWMTCIFRIEVKFEEARGA